MTTSKVVRSRKGVLNCRTCLPACRVILYVLALPFLAHAWQSAAPPVGGCQTAGQISGWDIFDHTFSLKSDSGHYSDFRYDGSTVFTNGDKILQPDNLGILEALNIDDRLCVEAFRGDSGEIASLVRVRFRSEINARDKQELIRWQAESLFGRVKSLDTATQRITVKVSASSDVSVDAGGSVAFWNTAHYGG